LLLIALSAACYAADETTETEAEATFKSLYGQEVTQAMRTISTLDDVKLAGKLLEAASTSRNEPELLKLICDKAYDLGKKNSTGFDVAIEAMNVLSANSPDAKIHCLDKIVGIHQLRYTRTKLSDRAAAAGTLLDAMMDACDANAQAGNIAAAKLQCLKASRLATVARLPQKEALQAKYKELVVAERSARLVKGYEARLKADPSHIASREALINIYLIEKNDPAGASRWLNEDCDERLRMFIPMAAGDISAIAIPTLMELGDWYKSLAAAAQLANKGGLLIRAQTYYEAFIAKHPAADLAKTKAILALSKVRTDIKKYGVKVPEQVIVATGVKTSAVSRKVSVRNPAKIPGVKAWTVEIRDYLGKFYDVEFSEDSSQMITAGQDGSLRFWDVETGKLLRVLMGHDGDVRSLAWSGDRKILASGSSDKTIRLWDTVEGKVTKILRGSTGSVKHLSWSPDSQGLASSSGGPSVRIWSLRTGKLAGSLKAADYVYDMAWGQTGSLAAGISNGNLSLWNVRSGKPYGHYPLDQYKYKGKLRAHSIHALAWSPVNPRLMAVGFSTGTIKLWRTGTRVFPQTMKPENKDKKGRSRIGPPSCMEWSPNGKMLAVGDSGTYGGYVWFWNIPGGTKKLKIDDHAGNSIRNITWSPDGKFVATAADDATSSLIDVEAGEVARKIQANRMRGAARPDFSADGTLMAFSCRDGTIRIWDIVKCKQVSAITADPKGGYVTAIRWSPDASKIAFLGYGSGSVQILDVKSGVVAASLPGGETRIYDIVWSSDSKKVITSQGARSRKQVGDIRVWDVATVGVDFALSDKDISSHYQLDISPDNKTLASTASRGRVNLWSMEEKKLIRTIPADGRTVREIAFTPDGKKLASCGEESTVKVWSVSTGQPVFGLRKHETEVHRVDFSPDGTKLVSVDARYNMAVWDMTTGKNIAWFRASNWRICWMRDSETVAAANGSGVHFYNASDGARKGSYFPLPKRQGLLIASSGHYSGTSDVEKSLFYQAVTVSGQKTLSPEEFTERFGWKNDPSKVRVIEGAPASDKTPTTAPK
jgi:WD40 repeat protein